MTLQERDTKHLWHPLTQHKTHPKTIGLTNAKGCVLKDEKGNTYIDAIASWYTCMYGHCNPIIITAVYKQMQQLDQVVFSGFTHEPAVALSETLIQLLPENQNKLFFSDNGSTATEIGIKMALQYHHNLGAKKKILIAFEEGFHGDTFGAMAVSGLSVYNGAFEDFFIKVLRIPVPTGTNNEGVLKLLERHTKEYAIAGFIYEPLVQGAAGMKIYDIEGLEAILTHCAKHNIITIADEVMTGFGKTGRNFASDYVTIKPDIICLSKALTAGMLPMAITSCSTRIYDAFYDDDITKGLFHGHTYTANPLACAAALAGISLLNSKEIQENILLIIASHKQFLKKLSKSEKATNLRQLGVILAFELTLSMERYGNQRDRIFDAFMKQGVFLRPLGNTLYLLPPYTISKEELETVYNAIDIVLKTL